MDKDSTARCDVRAYDVFLGVATLDGHGRFAPAALGLVVVSGEDRYERGQLFAQPMRTLDAWVAAIAHALRAVHRPGCRVRVQVPYAGLPEAARGDRDVRALLDASPLADVTTIRAEYGDGTRALGLAREALDAWVAQQRRAA